MIALTSYRASRDKFFPTRTAPKAPCREMEFKTNEGIAVCSSPVAKHSRVNYYQLEWSPSMHRSREHWGNDIRECFSSCPSNMYRRWEVRAVSIPNSNSAVKPDAFQLELGPRLRNICITLKHLHPLMIGFTNMLRIPRWERLARSAIAGMP